MTSVSRLSDVRVLLYMLAEWPGSGLSKTDSERLGYLRQLSGIAFVRPVILLD